MNWRGFFQVRRDRALRDAFRRSLLNDDGLPTPDAAMLLAHLRWFCNADTTTIQRDQEGRVDAVATAMMAGRRDVWLQIAFYLNVDEAQLLEADRRFMFELTQEMARAGEMARASGEMN